MTDVLKTILPQRSLKTTAFPPTSRYHGIDTSTIESEEGKIIVHLCRRFVPSPEQFVTLQEHAVSEGDRLDNITAEYLGDPDQFWQICDANGVMKPSELTQTIGHRIRITLPEGIPGNQNA